MTDFKFKVPQRYDAATAQEGVFFEVVDEYDTSWGEFKCIYSDEDERRIKLASDRLKVKYAKEIRTGKVSTKVLQFEMFLDALLVDWRGVKDDKGKEIPFTKEAARAYFEIPEVAKFVLPHLYDYISDVRNFKLVVKDEVTGNS